MKSILVASFFFVWNAWAAMAQDADVTFLVDGPLLAHGGVVEVSPVPVADADTTPITLTLTDRYARVRFSYPEGASYSYRFRPVPDAMDREGMDQFRTELLSYGSGGDTIRVFPFEEYGAPDDATRTNAAWGQTQRFADPPPANHWGARALPLAFDTFGNRRTVGLICRDDGTLSVCTPDPEDALLLEALWWRSIAEGRLERLRHDALRDCYDSGGLLNRPALCGAVPGRGWPAYEPLR